MIRSRCLRFAMVLLPALAMLCACGAAGQTAADGTQSAGGDPQITDPQPKQAQTQPALPEAPEPQGGMPEEELKQEEHQRVLGVIPSFISTDDPNAPPLTSKQKLNVAFRTAVDPFAFAVAGLDAAYSQVVDNFAGYGPGAQGYAKRYAAAYVDGFDGTMLGNAIFPILTARGPAVLPQGHGEF